MRHGRDHEEREQKIQVRRSNNTPESDSFEAELLTAGRQRGTPRQRVFGAHEERVSSASEPDEPVNDGSEVAPTKRAEEREQERHRLERKIGRLAAGTGENLRDRREPDVTREDLDEAAREADKKVAGHELPKKKS
jgi:hypothetical protein